LRNPEIDAEVTRIELLSGLATYYNVNMDRIVDVWDEDVQRIRNWIETWDKLEVNKRKKILLVTGVPGCGKSWFTYNIVSELFSNGHEILEIKGDKIEKYPTGISKNSFPIFILDDRHVGIEGIAGGIPVESVCQIIQKSIHNNFAGPVIISIRRDSWNRLISGSVTSCKKLTKADEKRIVELKEININSRESESVAYKISSSFYETVDGKTPPFKLFVEPNIKKKIIEHSKNNLIILKIFFEEIGRTKPANYKISTEDVDGIISNPIYYILFQLINHYSGEKKNPCETAEILAGLHYIAESGSMSVGSLYHLWHSYYEKESRKLPVEVFRYLKNMFLQKKLHEWPPPLFDIDRYGSIISFHGSVDRTLVSW
jgi:hypothetical protein